MDMDYISTRGNAPRVSSSEAIRNGLAPDGGLYVPENIPTLTSDDFATLQTLSYPERSAFILSRFLTDYTYQELLTASREAYAEASFGVSPAPVVRLDDNRFVLELWHGPTCAFKDMALQIMPRLLSLAVRKNNENKQILILVATSGDTGKAALEGYKDVDGVKIMVFYPEDGVSDIQKLQMTSQTGNNVCVCAIRGNFDHAQSGVKAIFSDKEIAKELSEKGYILSSANSINWGRLAPQIVYYLSAYCDLLASGAIQQGEPLRISVPTGNFGDILAAYYAMMMGLPVEKLICASNSNHVLTDFLETGTYDRNRTFYTTMSPSMDILISSNLERLLFMLQGPEKTAACMKELAESGCYTVSADVKKQLDLLFEGQFATEGETAETIRTTFEGDRYLCDPHTAVGLCAAKKAQGTGRTLIVSTASPYKFSADVLYSFTGEAPSKDFFAVIDRLEELSATPAPAPILALRNASRRFNTSAGHTKEEMWEQVKNFLF